MSEMLSIPGLQDALDLSYKNSRELNRIIDHQLPSHRPRFQRAEIELEGSTFDVYYRDVIACIRALFTDKSFAPYLVFAPERHYSDERQENRLYHDMHTGKWWWTTQEKLDRRSPGATVIPVIIASDKTQITLFGGKSMYPVYITIGNIPKQLRRKVSQQTQILLAYLPTTHLEHIINEAAKRRMVLNILHTALREILRPLRKAGLDGLNMTTGDGMTHRTHPILAAHVGDYMENIAIVGCKMGECPRCTVPFDELGDFELDYPLRNLREILDALATYDTDRNSFARTCRNAGIKPIPHPYWEDLPFVDIFMAITPDILHQLYQGLVRHLISWIKKLYSHEQLDARIRCLPLNSHVRHFWKGMTHLSRPTGQEHSELARVILGVIIDTPLPNGQSPVRLVKATRALLDFLYLAQYPVHSSETLNLLHDALERFHIHKKVFVDLGVRDSWRLPKLHFASHYVALIKSLGTTDNFNTEYTERLHIDFAKDAYDATNHKNELPQMTLWLERREKMLQHDKHVRWCEDGCPPLITQQNLFPLPPPSRIVMTKHPSRKAVPLGELARDYHALSIKDALAHFIICHADPSLTKAQAEARAAYLDLPFRTLPIYHKAKFWLGDNEHHRLMSDELNAALAVPSRTNDQKQHLPARFDTVLVNGGFGEFLGVTGYRVARLRVIFSIPSHAVTQLFPPNTPPPRYLAYVEWFTPFPRDPHPHHLLYHIKRSVRTDGLPLASVIPLNHIRHSIQLFPSFGPVVSHIYSSENVLDMCPSFYVNSFTDRHSYHTVI
ncbi:hypothetical protein BDY19DRAFT_1006916 [Irpex rosettiformis]|uniref:Uncharacterized protein n=1 Tax=Irpex rosettiformis TaxID=378272 RepID=A0ACB8U3N1_9APHY|nr:hypothetical protein BDY19DRAFT_1006916 [Irpex rosettiformis]